MRLVVAALAVALLSCGPPTVTDIGPPWFEPDDGIPYRFLPYAVLRSVLTDTMQIPSGQSVGDDPVHDPVSYLDANRFVLGSPDWENGAEAITGMTTGGVKVWTIASSSACAIWLQQNPALSFERTGNYDKLYITFMARVPTVEEIKIMDHLRIQFGTRGDVAVCSALLASLEFMQE